ncbi:MAG: glutamine--tRNA ligase/YqeY domain fusion protein [Desulfovibrionaceae bacterium]|nr:glutamine--tRNA ligase/YqeY domain fusion protein [Desulfovibrionaceae bacterium]
MTKDQRPAATAAAPSNFIKDIVRADVRAGAYNGRVQTRFPPEPNGYLHIGHAKSICLNFGLAAEFGGRCNLRFDDTNPVKEDVEYVESIKQDVRWLGFDWGDGLFYASDYFERLYAYASRLVEAGKAYVDDQSADEIRENRGTLTSPGKDSPWRNRPVEENLDLFGRMRAGEFEDGSRVLRAKIDMSHPNMVLRDPTLYRIKRVPHHRTGQKWPIYPMYDFAHCLSDAIEAVTHSICTLEFENNRALYDWVLDELGIEPRPRQYEFARLNLTHTALSKRKLIRLVREGRVAGWDDPRMPTISGLRRRGYTPESIRTFCERIGVSKAENLVDMALLEHCLREDLNRRAPRVMGVLDPLRLVIENYPEDQTEEFEFANNPEDEAMGRRMVPFSRVLYVERDDFREQAPGKWFRLAPGREVRLRYAYYVTCTDVVRDASGEVAELRCSFDPKTRGGWSKDGRKVKGTLHWVSAAHAVRAEVRLYGNLFSAADPSGADEAEFMELLNPDSLRVLPGCMVEPGLCLAKPGEIFQFERNGYFCLDPDSTPGRPVFNRATTLRDTWARIERQKDK